MCRWYCRLSYVCIVFARDLVLFCGEYFVKGARSKRHEMTIAGGQEGRGGGAKPLDYAAVSGLPLFLSFWDVGCRQHRQRNPHHLILDR